MPTTLIMLLMVPHMFWLPVPGYLAIVAVLAFPVVFLYGGFATHRSARRSLTNGTANMDVLISMGSLPPYLIGLVGFVYPMTYFIEMAATITTFHMLGRYLETYAKGRASQVIKRLSTLGAKSASVLRDSVEADVPIAELRLGDVMVVRPGAKIPTDGEIVEGSSHMGPHWSPFHLLSFVFIGGGFVLIATAWRVLHEAQRQGRLATAGPYARLRHPQYVGFALIMIGFFLQWPTLVTALMLPILLVMYWRLARHEEREVEAAFGERYRLYADRVPAFVPRLSRAAKDAA